MPDKLLVDFSPHIHCRESTSRIMWSVFLALLPSGFAGLILFGMPALKIIFISILSCVLTEALIQKLRHKKISISDGSAVLTGILLAYNLSPSVPFWIPVVGGVFAIAVVKETFGGLGANIFNPALASRAFLLASWPKQMMSFALPFSVDTITSATPLVIFKESGLENLARLGLSYGDLFLGKRPGCIGEVCILALLIGAVYLLVKGYISWHIPLTYIASLGVLTYIFGAQGLFSGNWLFHLLSGGLILGAFFMATDYVTSPLTRKGQLIFGFGCGLLTFIIRRFGGYPEGVSYSILMMNAVVPLIDRYVKPRIYGMK